MDFGTNKTPVEIILELIVEIFILMLMISGTKTHGKNLMFQRILIKSIIVQIIIMPV